MGLWRAVAALTWVAGHAQVLGWRLARRPRARSCLQARRKTAIHLKRAPRGLLRMGSRKSSSRKIRLFKKVKQTSPVPAWVILKTKRAVRTNPKRRPWRTGNLEVG